MSIAGIDVSHFNGEVDWHAAADSISFAFAKATQGTSYVDPRFAQNWISMKNAAIPRGAYHFFDPTKSAAAQAEHFLATVTIETDDLPPVLDIENLTGPTPASISTAVAYWLGAVHSATKRVPVVYTSANFWQKLGNPSRPGDCALWVAHYDVPKPRLPQAWNDWTFWQFSQLGRCHGIKGYVDLNRFQGDVNDLRRSGR